MVPKTFQFILIVATIAVCFGAPQDTFAQNPKSHPAIGQENAKTDSQLVESYLHSLQLDELLIEHLEIETSRELNLDTRREMASRLINEYAQRMMSGQKTDQDWQTKSELLLKTYPELETPFVRIAILQSKYLLGETSFRGWWDSGRPADAKDRLIEDWRSLKSELESLNRKLINNYEDQVAAIQAIPESRDKASNRLVHIEGLLLHTDYLIGWSAYFLGVLSPENRMQFMRSADQHFRHFLQIEPEKTLTEVPPEWFDFSSDWNSRALVGLAMSQRGLNHNLQSKYCFDLIANHATNPRTRELRLVWDLNSRIYLNEVSAALKYVEASGDAREVSEAGRQAFWTATLNAGIAIHDQTPLVSERLIRAGLRGWARDFEAELIYRFVEQHGIQLSKDEFADRWIGGLIEFHQAETLNQPVRYDAARDKLTAALEVIDGSTDPFDIVRCKFLVARIQFMQREYETAAAAFLECSEAADAVDPQLAAESQWLAIRSLSEHSRKNTRSLIPAMREIDQIMRRFPGSSFTKRAEFEKLRISLAGLPARSAIQKLSQVSVDDPNYATAVNEIAKIKYQVWLRAHQSNQTTSASQSLEALIQTESMYRQLKTASEESKLKTMLLVIDAMLRVESTPLESIRHRLDLARELADNAMLEGQIYVEYRYYEFRYADRSGRQETAIAEAKWLSKNAQGTSFEKSALIQLAQLADQQLLEQVSPAIDEYKKVVSIFERLVGLLGSSDENLKSSANARVAYARLAELRLAAGSVDQAIEMLELLNRIFPNHKSYLRQLGLARTNAQQYSQAILIWRKLAGGVDPGSEFWYESKYYLATCLHQSGEQAAARELHRQTCHLSPDLPEIWKPRFEELTRLLEKN